MEPNSSLGISVDFPKETFESAIRFAMQMAVPNDPDRRLKFVKKSAVKTYWKDDVLLLTTPRLSRDGRPFDPDVEIRVGEDEVIGTDPDDPDGVSAAIEIERADADEIPVGNFRGTKAIVTMLPDDYVKVEGCREIRYNGDIYKMGYEPDAYGLFDSGVHTMIFYALDES